jgi:hypothetical protein
MKQILWIVLLSIVLLSCEQTELEYSCDPVINKYVLENKAEFSHVSVTELTSYDVALQKAVFRSWDPDKKRDAWLDKFHQVLCSVSLSTEESDHIQKLIDHLEVGYFLDENIQKNYAHRVQFADEWLGYATKDLGWSKQFIAFLVYRLYTNQSQFEAELSAIKSINAETSTDSESGTCNCNISTDFCSGSSCYSNGCIVASGCGWIWSSPCNGSC